MSCIKNLEEISRQNESETRDHFLFPLIESPQDLNCFLESYAIEIYYLEKMNSNKDNSSPEITALFDYLDIKFNDIKNIELSQAQLDFFDFYYSKISSSQKHHKLVFSVFSQRKVIANLSLNTIKYLQQKFPKHNFEILKMFFEKEIKNEHLTQNLKNELKEMIVYQDTNCEKLIENLKTFYQLREKVWNQILKTIQLQKGIAK
ncbi:MULTISPECIES: DUF3050 domain-containing protein [Psychroflexus]|uniref:Uncharacterized protein n=1 Tax=Psychroflexus halocasei TaxID=908615 RepID=A0A1H4D0E7_9FLAO|nr:MULTISPECIES: DUF3050 domain-containing protein [Psychroflexus]PJX22735.1 hypothetical protein CAP47_06820 [Psychroflexus sp. S27]SEA66235.1 Protein of unknown function [Psychroflexus halocasei]